MQDRITRARLPGDPPDVFVNPHLGRLGLFEFIAPTKQSHWAPRQPRRRSNSWARRSGRSAEANPRSGTPSECTIRKTTQVRFPLQLSLLSARVASFWEPEPCFIPTRANRIKQ